MEEAEERSLTGRDALIHPLLLAILSPLLLFAASVSTPLLKLMEAERGRGLQDFPQAAGYVNDFAGVIDSESEASLLTLCEELQRKTGAELAVVTVATVGDMDYTEYSTRLFEKWKIGEKDKNNGVLLFLTVAERRVRVEVGYGLEGALPDITAGRILDQYVVDDLRRGNVGQGFLKGARAIAGKIAEEYGVELDGAPPPRIRSSRQKQGGGIGKLLMMLIIFLIFARPRWLLPFLMMGGGKRRGGWGGGFGGGFGGGGFGGGGFGGFGGGGSGGGGAGRGF